MLNQTFAKYDVMVAEGLNTSIQQQQQFMQMIELNNILGGIIPPKFMLKHATIQGKNEIIAAVEEREAQAAEMAKQQQMLMMAKTEAELQNLQARSASEIATARERHGRAESNIGLFEERLSEITQNRSMALKNKMEALEKLLSVIQTYGVGKAKSGERDLEQLNKNQEGEENKEKADAKLTSESNEFLTKMMNNMPKNNNMNSTEQGVQQ
jgi:hypothetical protein